jgi:hypothetical protein
MSHTLQDWLTAAEGDAALRAPMRLRERIDALDRLELYTESSDDSAALARADVLRAELEAINRHLYASLRHDIRHGGNAFAPWIDTLETAPAGDGYDYRDDLLSGVLALDEPGEIAPLPPEMVFYQPTPARHVFELIRRAALDERDLVVDLGSGLGIVPLLVAVASKARAAGIELERSYVDVARRCASSLGLSRATFECADARSADLREGTLFYFYTPFTGSVMQTVLAALRREAMHRRFRVAAFGPCVPILAAQDWLQGDADLRPDRLALFHHR